LRKKKEWSPQDLTDLRICAEIGDTLSQIAAFLSRTEEDVRQKAIDLGIKISDE